MKVKINKSAHHVDSIKDLSLLDKILYTIHNSLFVQLMLTAIMVSLVLIYVHFKFRNTYNKKYNELIKYSEATKNMAVIDEESKIIHNLGEEESFEDKKSNNDEKFAKLLNVIESSITKK